MNQKKDVKDFKKGLVENIVSIGTALVLVFMIRSSVIEAFKIPSGSMIPTLLVGDHIFVNKFSYGFKLPFSDWFTMEPITLISRDGPSRGDIVVFKFPQDESIYYIKRVIGIPGDKVELRDKVLLVNDQSVPREPVPEEKAAELMELIDDMRYQARNLDVLYEKRPDIESYVMFDKNNFIGANFGPIIVPKEHYFVMGDNRDYSNDSRFWGFVPRANIKGRALFIWLSLWVSFSDGKFVFRPSRIGSVLH